MDLIEYPSDAQLINVITYDYNSKGQNYFMKIISQLISHAKCSAVVWCRKNSVESFATNLSVGFYGDEHYGAHFSLESTEREGVFKLLSRNESSDIADLYLIKNEFISVFDFNSYVQGCMRNYSTKYVFVDDIDNMELPSEFMTLKSNRIFDYDEKDGNVCQNLQVVKDNKNSTGKVLMTKEKNYYGL